MTLDHLTGQITTGDAFLLEATLPDASIDIVYVDPPYLKADVQAGIYQRTAQVASRVLVPGGWLLAYCPGHWKLDAMRQMSDHLSYFWDYIVVHMGDGNGLAWGKRTQICYTSILAFQKPGVGQVRPPRSIMDVYRADRINKQYHKWQQDAVAAQYYLSCFTRPGALVLDMFTGGGTIPCVCTQLGRRFIAFEIETAQAEIARQRLAVTQPLLGMDWLEQPHLAEEDCTEEEAVG